MSEQEDARRQAEISMFAAMAQGDAEHGDSPGLDSARASAAEDATRNLFSQAAMGADPSGTFNLQDQDLGDGPRPLQLLGEFPQGFGSPPRQHQPALGPSEPPGDGGTDSSRRPGHQSHLG